MILSQEHYALLHTQDPYYKQAISLGVNLHSTSVITMGPSLCPGQQWHLQKPCVCGAQLEKNLQPLKTVFLLFASHACGWQENHVFSHKSALFLEASVTWSGKAKALQAMKEHFYFFFSSIKAFCAMQTALLFLRSVCSDSSLDVQLL